MPSSDRIKEAMETLLKIFKEDNLEKVARAVFRGGDIPADKWSFLNRVLMFLNETDDARGFRLLEASHEENWHERRQAEKEAQ